MIIVSACLAGVNCKYSGGNNEDESVVALVKEGKAMPVCPEVLGGLEIPRACCEIVTDTKGHQKVLTEDGKDVTDLFIAGARKTLAIAVTIGAKAAILQPRSPSCGYGKIYDGSFSGELNDGDGITAALLAAHNVRIYEDGKAYQNGD